MSKSKETNAVKLAVIMEKVGYIEEKVDAIDRKMESNYGTKAEFAPVKQAVYGVIGLMLTAVVGSLLGLVLIK